MIAFLFGLGTAFDNPARQSFVYELVGPERLPNAIGLNSATFHAARIVGPAVAGFVIAGFGTGWAILSNAVTYLAFIAALRLLDAWRLLSWSPGWSAAGARSARASPTSAGTARSCSPSASRSSSAPSA